MNKLLVLCLVSVGTLANANEIDVEYVSLDIEGIENYQFGGLSEYQDQIIIAAWPPRSSEPPTEHVFFSVGKDDVLSYGQDSAPLQPEHLQIEGLNGEPGEIRYDAVATKGDEVFLIYVDESTRRRQSMLASGQIDWANKKVNFDASAVEPLPFPKSFNTSLVKYRPIAYKSILVMDSGKLLLLFEANGAVINEEAEAIVYDPTRGSFDFIEFPNLDYSITDTTVFDGDGFWALNVFYPIYFNLYKPQEDPEVDRTGFETHENTEVVERLVYYTIDAESNLNVQKYAYLRLLKGTDPWYQKTRNWQGLERLNKDTLLAVTRKFPSPLFARIDLNATTM